jgi:hypothetical protein
VCVLDFGVPINSPANYAYQIYRDGVAISASGTGATVQASYAPVAADVGTLLSFSCYATNSAGNSETVYSGSIFIS